MPSPPAPILVGGVARNPDAPVDVHREQPGRHRDGTGTSGDPGFASPRPTRPQAPNTIKFSVAGTITLNSALPDLSNTSGVIDIEGPGAASLTVARSSAAGTPDFGIFTIDTNANVQMTGLTITGGLVDLHHVPGGNSGAGISNAGTLTITNSTITNNSGLNGAGGGITSVGTLTVTDSTITNNLSTLKCAASAAVPSAAASTTPIGGVTVTIGNCTIANNIGEFGGNGGGIENDSLT